MNPSFNYRPVHPFPARMAPDIALKELKDLGRKKLRVLDPMMGSGTTLVTARSLGHEVIGFDTDPLAVIIARTWCAGVNKQAVLDAADKIVKKANKKLKEIKQRDAYPSSADDETKKFIRYWFDIVNRKQLRVLSDAIQEVDNAEIKNVLWCAFSRLIIAKSKGASLAKDLSHSRPHKVAQRSAMRPLSHFLPMVKYVLKNMPFTVESNTTKSLIQKADARSLPLNNNSIDLVITSPPYLNAIDYLRCNKFSLVWMKHQIPAIRTLRSSNIGSESALKTLSENPYLKETMAITGKVEKLPVSSRRILMRYLKDMDSVLSEIGRVLVKNGRCVLVIGNSTMRGTFLKNSNALIQMGKHYNLKTQKVRARKLPTNRRYLPPPSSKYAGTSLQSRMREELVITMIKSS